MEYKTRSFTLVELLVVLAIIGLLSSIAIPMYKDRLDNVKISRLVELAALYGQRIQNYYEEYGRMPTYGQMFNTGSTFDDGNPPVLPGWTQYITSAQLWWSTNANQSSPPYPAYYITVTLANMHNSVINNHVFIYSGYLQNGVWVKQCGQWNSDNPAHYVNPTYMPSFCNNPNVQINPGYF